MSEFIRIFIIVFLIEGFLDFGDYVWKEITHGKE